MLNRFLLPLCSTLILCSCGAQPFKTSTPPQIVQCPEAAFQAPPLPTPLPQSPRADIVAGEDVDAFGMWAIWILDGTAARKCLQVLEDRGIIKVTK